MVPSMRARMSWADWLETSVRYCWVRRSTACRNATAFQTATAPIPTKRAAIATSTHRRTSCERCFFCPCTALLLSDAEWQTALKSRKK